MIRGSPSSACTIIIIQKRNIMYQITAQWFDVKVKHDTLLQNGKSKTVTETYAVDAVSFTEAEARITKEIAEYYKYFEVKAITIAPYQEIYFMGDDFTKACANEQERLAAAFRKRDNKALQDECEFKETDTCFYRVRLAFLSEDDKGKEKRSVVTYLVEGTSPQNAAANIDTAFDGTTFDYQLVSIVETKIVDILLHTLNTKEEKKK